MFGILGIEGGWDSVISNGHRPILGPRHGLINMFINHTVSPLPYVVAWQPDIPYMLYISQQQLNSIWNQGSRLPHTDCFCLGCWYSFFIDNPSTLPSTEANTPWQLRPT